MVKEDDRLTGDRFNGREPFGRNGPDDKKAIIALVAVSGLGLLVWAAYGWLLKLLWPRAVIVVGLATAIAIGGLPFLQMEAEQTTPWRLAP